MFHGPQGKARALLSDLSLEKPKVVCGQLSKSFTPHSPPPREPRLLGHRLASSLGGRIWVGAA